MKRAQVSNFKSIENSGDVLLDRVTCLVGKNESGKTAFLEALRVVSPAGDQQWQYEAVLDYPKRRYIHYKKQPDQAPRNVATLTLELDAKDLQEMEESYGGIAILTHEITYTCGYDGLSEWSMQTDPAVIIPAILKRFDLPAPTMSALSKARDWREFTKRVEESEAQGEEVDKLKSYVKSLGDSPEKDIVTKFGLKKRLPQFFYFDDYSLMPGKIDLLKLKQTVESEEEIDPDLQTFRAFLEVAGTSIDEILDEDEYERVKAELEAASIAISERVFEFWSQNKELHVELDKENRVFKKPNGEKEVRPMFHVRVRHDRHKVTLPFGNRSKGFVWFFSFLCYFSRIESDSNVVLLLDEPGLNLHAMAQRDFLRMINELLAPNHQVIYTTHSPFMVDMKALNAVRTVEDQDADGTIVTEEVLRTGPDTVFPLQAALGYDLAQSMFLGENCLIIEGPSDLIYLNMMTDILEQAGRTGLDPAWVPTPVGGGEKIPTFVALLGSNDLNMAVLTDVDAQFAARLESIRATGLLAQNRIITPSTFVSANEADIEDLFDPNWYLALVNETYAADLDSPLSLEDLPPHPRIVKRLETHFGRSGLPRFNHTRVARFASRNVGAAIPVPAADALIRFEELCTAVNKFVG